MKNKIWEKLLLLWHFTFCILHFTACSISHRISKQAHNTLIDAKQFSSAQIGICIFDSTANRFLYNYQSDKYFVPASNVKLFTLYAGLKYMQDSLVAARIAADGGTIVVQATGDPTFLHPDFTYQPLLKFLQRDDIEVIRLNTSFASSSFGEGWSWEDFTRPYMAERDPFPIYGNMASIIFESDSLRTIPPSLKPFVVGLPAKGKHWSVTRQLGGHTFIIDTTKGNTDSVKKITMAMDRGLFATRYLSDTLHKVVLTEYEPLEARNSFPLYSQPKDSLFKIMMHRSDNFFAEQTLLMAAEEFLGEMNDTKMIDTLIKTDFKEAPQVPQWADGSGLSRYNLFTPQDFVWLLNKLKKEYGMQRFKTILPTANEGTLEGLYKGYENKIYAKTGTLNNHIALSGFVFTRHNKRLTFSVLINNHLSTPGQVRKQIEKFLTGVIDKY